MGPENTSATLMKNVVTRARMLSKGGTLQQTCTRASDGAGGDAATRVGYRLAGFLLRAARDIGLRICFICIGYEPGRDGVGDYVRGLIGHLPANVTAVTVIAINDPFASGEEAADGVFRIPSRWPSRERYARAASVMRGFDPDVVSLQFVTWAFGPKGIVLGEARALHALVGNRCLHIMWHEPWVRTSRRQGTAQMVKSMLLGQIQRASIKRLAAILRPAVCDTSNRDYQALFRKAGIATDILPIFGSIVRVAGYEWGTVRALARAEGKFDPGDRASYFVAGLFGAIRDTWDALPLLRNLVALAAQTKRRLLLVSVGHNTPLGDALLAQWTAAIPEMVSLALGGQPPAAISQVIASLDVGLAHQPATALGRSTTTAAFLEHGIPVITAMGGMLEEEDPFVRRWGPLLVSHGPTLAADIRRARGTLTNIGDLRREVAAQFVASLERHCAV